MDNILTNIFGYIAMALLVVSFIPKKMTVVRTINLIACTFFIVYGYLLSAWPIVISNLAVCTVQIYHLFFAKNKVSAEIAEK